MKTIINHWCVRANMGLLLMALAAAATASLLPIAEAPLFVTNSQKANVLVILDDSNSMDENASGGAVGSASPDSKSEIARKAVKNLITAYSGKINMGLMAYQQVNIRHRNLDNSPYDASYNPANYDPAFTGDRGSRTKKFRMVQADNPGNYIYYNVALPFYHTGGVTGDTMYCYSDKGPDPEPNPYTFTPINGLGIHYRCFHHKKGTSDARADSAYLNYWFKGSFSPTDSDLAQNIHAFGARLASVQISPTWFSNSSPGRGYLHIPVADLDSIQAGKLNIKLATSQFVTNGPTDPTLPLQNAGLTPIEGTLLTAKDYFEGSLTKASEGGPQAAPPESCGKNFIALLTDGLPSTDKDGDVITNPATAIAAAANAAAALKSAQIGIKQKGIETYMIGFALPYGVDPTTLDQVAVAGGTGSAYQANDPTTLQAAFNAIFTDILAKTGASSSSATNSTSLSQNSHIYQARFNSGNWSGQLLSRSIDSNGVISATADWDAGSVLNGQSPSTRQIITFAHGSKTGIPFQWTNIAGLTDTTQKDFLNMDALGNVDGLGNDRVNYLRGGTNAGFRTRSSKLGDIINSSPFYLGPPAAGYIESEMKGYKAFHNAHLSRMSMLYVGANDGMLHGFDANNGEEKMAYVPGTVYAHLSDLTDPNYAKSIAHRYFVDGSPMVADANLGDDITPDWKTVLAGGLNAGGQGYYALDVTDPSSLTEANAANIVLWEFTDKDDPDIGLTFNQPMLNRLTNQSAQIARMENGQWALIVGNGYNNSAADGHASTTGHAYLYILYLHGPTGVNKTWVQGTDYIKIDTGVGSVSTPNGLATPKPVDTTGDGRVDTIYAGDLSGNLWKFDLSDTSASGWKVAYGTTSNPAPLFTAKDAANNAQPITTAPLVTFAPNGNMMVGFATGKYLGVGDITTTNVQTIYGILDKGATVSGRSELVAQTVDSVVNVGTNTVRVTSRNPVNYATRKGWYLDLPDTGERVAFNPIIRDGRFIFTTLVPNTGLCASGGSSWLMELDYLTGGRLFISPFTAIGKVNGNYASGIKIRNIMTTPTVIGDRKKARELKIGNESSGDTKVISESVQSKSGRLSWREIIR